VLGEPLIGFDSRTRCGSNPQRMQREGCETSTTLRLPSLENARALKSSRIQLRFLKLLIEELGRRIACNENPQRIYPISA
jgi:hypothetical protein